MNKIIICDTREKGNKKILEYFTKVNQDYIISKLDAGDYCLFKDYTTIIDKKDGLLELAGNLCHTAEHERIKRERHWSYLPNSLCYHLLFWKPQKQHNYQRIQSNLYKSDMLTLNDI